MGVIAKRKPPKRTASKSTRFGDRIIAGLTDLVETLETGGIEAVEKKFTVHRVPVRRFETPDLTSADVADIRKSVGASQVVFASLLGVHPNTVRAWEQGENPLSGMAVRFLAEIRRDPAYWIDRLASAATGVA